MVDKANAVREEVIREFPPVGKYRIRLVRNARRPEAAPALDIREYVTSETFEGFTRRGIRLTESAQIELLRDILKDVLAQPADGGASKA